jgi:MATE family multidrug resistance protein
MNFFTNIVRVITNRYRYEAGYKHVFAVAIPLIFSTGSWALQHFIDRMFLNWYSKEAVAASMPSGILNFTLASLFIGTAGYVSTFVAQYFGSGRNRMIGPVVWQGIYISVISGIVIMLFIPYSDEIFTLIGHTSKVRELESAYFRILCMGAIPLVASSALSGFFSGLGKTWIVMVANFAATLENIVMDYLLIFGKLGFAEMGIEGAAIATVLSSCVSFAIYAAIVIFPAYNAEFNILGGWRFSPRIFWRLLRFGLPNGVQFFLDVAGFTLFVMFIGRLGTDSLAATNIAFNINTVAFMPMIGLGIAVSVMVGQYLGKNDTRLAVRAVYSGLHIAILYLGIIALLYAFAPDIFIAPYAARANPADFNSIGELTRVLLKFVALYCIFDGMNIIFSSAIKGAGDTRFVMIVIVISSIGVLIVPSYFVLFVFDLGILASWVVATGYVIVLGLVFMFRFLDGKWKNMRVIEASPVAIPPCMAEGPGCQD